MEIILESCFHANLYRTRSLLFHLLLSGVFHVDAALRHFCTGFGFQTWMLCSCFILSICSALSSKYIHFLFPKSLRRSYFHCTEGLLFDEANRNTSEYEQKSDFSLKAILLLGFFLIPPVFVLLKSHSSC